MKIWLTTTIPGLLTVSVIGTVLASFLIHLLKEVFHWLKRVLPPAVKRVFNKIGNWILSRLRRASKKWLRRMAEAEKRGRLLQYYTLLVMLFMTSSFAATLSFVAMMHAANAVATSASGEERTVFARFAVLFGMVGMLGILHALKTMFWVNVAYRVSDQHVQRLLKGEEQ